MDEYTFKHCPKGHYYQGNKCPYCKAQTTPLEEPLEVVVVDKFDHSSHPKVCYNGHVYGPHLNNSL